MLVFSSTKHGNDYVFVVFDQFSKMAILAPWKKSLAFEATTKLFFQYVWVHFWLPHTILSNRDSRLLNTF